MEEKFEKGKLDQLKIEFNRYFFLFPYAGGGNRSSLLGIFGRGDNRHLLSAIIPNRVYLGDIPRRAPFSPNIKIADTPNAALVVSCVDIGELAYSDLLLEPGSKNIKYHVVAMEDATAKTGNIEQICDALRLMSTFSEAKKPIHIHCFSGVGRSPMMTAAHLAHRYLLDDPDIKFFIDNVLLKSKIKLDPDGEDFIFNLYQASCEYVHAKRDCCQFNRDDRRDIAIKALTILYKEKKGQLKQPFDDNYAFINALVQSASFKKLHHEYYNDLNRFYESSKSVVELKVIIKKFFASFIVNKDNWYQQLMGAVNEQVEFKNYPLDQFCRASQVGLNEEQQKVSITDRRKLLTDLIETMNDLSLKFPTAEYSQPFCKAMELSNSAALYTP